MLISRTIRSFLLSTLLSMAFSVILVVGASPARANDDLVNFIDEPGLYNIGFFWTTYYVKHYGIYYGKVRYPAQNNGKRAWKDASEAPYPGILISSCFGAGARTIDWIGDHLTLKSSFSFYF